MRRRMGAPSVAVPVAMGRVVPSARMMLGEVDDGDVVGGEVAVDAGADAAGVVGAQLGDGAGDDGLRGEDECVVGVDGVDELGANRLADAHGKVVVDLDGEGGAGGECGGWGLAQRERRKQERQEKRWSVRGPRVI